MYGRLTILNDSSLAEMALGIVRNKETASPEFIGAARGVALGLLFAAQANIPTFRKDVETPMEEKVSVLSGGSVVVVSILRAGNLIADPIAQFLSESTSVSLSRGYADIHRDKKSQPIVGEIIVPVVERALYLLCDPALATGGSLCATLRHLQSRGISLYDVICLCFVASRAGVQRVEDENLMPRRLIVAALDEKLDNKDYIVPGLGDAGDRAYGVVQRVYEPALTQ